MNNPPLVPSLAAMPMNGNVNAVVTIGNGVVLTPRAIRHIKHVNRSKLFQCFDILKTRSARFAQACRGSRARRVQYMNRSFGTGSLGFRHRSDVNGRRSSLVNPEHTTVKVGRVDYTEIRSGRNSDPSVRDTTFNCSLLFGDQYLMMETFANFLDTVVFVGDHRRVPTDEDCRLTFEYFWLGLRTYMKLSKKDATCPSWAYTQNDARLGPNQVVFDGTSFNGVTLEHVTSFPNALPPRRVRARRG